MSAIIDHLLVKAMILVNHDGATVKRLVLASITNNPNKPAHWHLEKVIFDLERDRK